MFRLRNSNLSKLSQRSPGSIPGSGGGAHFYCGTSSHNFFWTPINHKLTPGMQNPEWEIFYVKWISGPCVVEAGEKF